MRRSALRGVTAALSGLMVAIGLVLLVETALAGGTLGYVLGALFLAAGILRLYLAR